MIGKLIILCIGLVALWAGANRIGRVLGLKSFMKVKVEKGGLFIRMKLMQAKYQLNGILGCTLQKIG